MQRFYIPNIIIKNKNRWMSKFKRVELWISLRGIWRSEGFVFLIELMNYAIGTIFTHTGMPPNGIHNWTVLTALTFIHFYSS